MIVVSNCSISGETVTMAPRSQLEIFTSSVLRLVNEEASYHRELKEQTEHLNQLEAAQGGEDENREYMLKQEVGEVSLSTTFRSALVANSNSITAPCPSTNEGCPSNIEAEDRRSSSKTREPYCE